MHLSRLRSKEMQENNYAQHETCEHMSVILKLNVWNREWRWPGQSCEQDTSRVYLFILCVQRTNMWKSKKITFVCTQHDLPGGFGWSNVINFIALHNLKTVTICARVKEREIIIIIAIGLRWSVSCADGNVQLYMQSGWHGKLEKMTFSCNSIHLAKADRKLHRRWRCSTMR